MNQKIHVIKASGEKELYSEEKVRRSIRRAGIPPQIEQEVIDQIRVILYDNIPTKKIYQKILHFLDQSSYPQGKGRYALKTAIMSLGPSGYPFEKFMKRVLKHQGYQAKTEIILQGKCTEHEIDLLIEKGKDRYPAECKFHNRPGTKTDIKVALYVKARFDDLLSRHDFTQPWLITNTKFTHRVIKYGQCVGLKLLSWNYPAKDSLRDWITQAKFHPLTCLSSLSREQKDQLLSQEIVLCRDLAQLDPQKAKSLGLPSSVIQKAAEEARLVCEL